MATSMPESGSSFRDVLLQGALPLGFGCSGLLGGLTRRESLRLIETALDCGISYFDTARLYGSGGAEGLLGEITPGVRQKIFLASKAGLLPGKPKRFIRLFYHGARSIYKMLPKLKSTGARKLQKYVRTPNEQKPVPGAFSPDDLRKSLDMSLQQLRTDYLDLFLLHECRLADIHEHRVFEVLQSLQREGKIRHFGLATGIDDTIRIAEAAPGLSKIAQIPNSIWEPNITRLDWQSIDLTITHSCFGERFHALADRLSTDQAMANSWHSMTGVDPHSKEAVAQLLFAHALRINADGIVLFSSSRPANIRANLKVVQGRIVDGAQIDGLIDFMNQCRTTGASESSS
jgi:diketogulonate reductase-like aldo/keto reductase